MKILALDPGGTTGYVLARMDDIDYSVMEPGDVHPEYPLFLLEHGEFNRWELIEPIISSNAVEIVIAETYIALPWKVRLSYESTLPIRILGILEYLQERYGFQFVQQKSADLKLINIPADLRKEIPGTHERDALKHLILYWERKNKC